MSRPSAAPPIIAIGGSAGALEPLTRILAGLPATLPAAVFVVIHTPADSPGLLPRILGRSCALDVRHAADGAAIEAGRVYVARPDHHLLVTLVRYRCHVGHAFTGEALLAGMQEELEQTLWSALRTVEENVSLYRRLAERARDQGHARRAQGHEEHAADMERRARQLQQLLRVDRVAPEESATG